MCSDLGSNRPLGHYRGCVSASFGSRYLVASLGRLGIGPRKSATVEPWDGPADLMPHYWRGLFDGDGSIYRISVRRDWYLSLCGSQACVDAFAAWAKSICGSRAQPHLARGECWYWAVGGGRMPQRLAKVLYGNATVSLARKQLLTDELLALDFDQVKADGNLRRAASMRASWRNGTHPRSVAAQV